LSYDTDTDLGDRPATQTQKMTGAFQAKNQKNNRQSTSL